MSVPLSTKRLMTGTLRPVSLGAHPHQLALQILIPFCWNHVAHFWMSSCCLHSSSRHCYWWMHVLLYKCLFIYKRQHRRKFNIFYDDFKPFWDVFIELARNTLSQFTAVVVLEYVRDKKWFLAPHWNCTLLSGGNARRDNPMCYTQVKSFFHILLVLLAFFKRGICNCFKQEQTTQSPAVKMQHTLISKNCT